MQKYRLECDNMTTESFLTDIIALNRVTIKKEVMERCDSLTALKGGSRKEGQNTWAEMDARGIPEGV